MRRRAFVLGTGALAAAAAIGALLAERPAPLTERAAPATEGIRPSTESAPVPTPSVSPSQSVMRPSRVVTHPAGLTESYDLVTERTFNGYFELVSDDRFRALAALQNNLPLFPFTPLSPTFSLGELVGTASTRSIVLYSERAAVRAAVDGRLATAGFGLDLNQRLSATSAVDFTCRWLGDAPNVKILFELPRAGLIGSTEGRETRRGELIAQFFGSGTFDNPGKYSAAANQLSFQATMIEKRQEPLVTVDANGTRNVYPNITSYPTPRISEPLDWIHTDTGKIAVIA